MHKMSCGCMGRYSPSASVRSGLYRPYGGALCPGIYSWVSGPFSWNSRQASRFALAITNAAHRQPMAKPMMTRIEIYPQVSFFLLSMSATMKGMALRKTAEKKTQRAGCQRSSFSGRVVLLFGLWSLDFPKCAASKSPPQSSPNAASRIR